MPVVKPDSIFRDYATVGGKRIKSLINEFTDKVVISHEDGQNVKLLDKFKSDLLIGVVGAIKHSTQLGHVVLTIIADDEAETNGPS